MHTINRMIQAAYTPLADGQQLNRTVCAAHEHAPVNLETAGRRLPSAIWQLQSCAALPAILEIGAILKDDINDCICAEA